MKVGLDRRRFLKISTLGAMSAPYRGALLSSAAIVSAPAFAQALSNRPIKIIVAYGPAGAVDFVPRLLAEKLTADLGQPVIVENRPGGLGMPAMNQILNSPADGHTILASDASHWATIPAMQPVTYDYLRDFAPVTVTFTGPQIIVVQAGSSINTLQDLIDQARSKPGIISFATPGIGSLHHLEGEVLAASLGIKFNHIPYKAAGEMAEALLRGDVNFTLVTSNAVLPHVKAGKFRMLAVTTKTRFKGVPDVPTVAEAVGVKDYDWGGRQGLVVRAGTPKPIIDRLSAAFGKAAIQPDVVAKAVDNGGVDMTPTSPEQLGEIIRADIVKFGNGVRLTGLNKAKT